MLGTEEESSDRHSSDEDIDVWEINSEQKDYYIGQWKTLIPSSSLSSMSTILLPGDKAKQFFEKSRLPVQELSKIWLVDSNNIFLN